jgi:hypothetical protein
MNIFYLDKSPRIAAEYHCDKHVVKMILESAQLLSSAHRFLDGQMVIGKSKSGRSQKNWVLNDNRENVIYKAGWLNHPSAIWARSNIDHYRYLYDLFVFLIDEYKYRYNGKIHKCETLLQPLFPSPLNIDYESPWQEPPQAMPEECRVPGDAVTAYRNYYIMHKKRFAKWTRRQVPDWFSVSLTSKEETINE